MYVILAGGGVSFSAWDVSGASRMRALWERHYRHAHAVIFVVDSADHLRLGTYGGILTWLHLSCFIIIILFYLL